MSDFRESSKKRRSKRRAAIDAATKIKKIVQEDIHYDHERPAFRKEEVNANSNGNKKYKRKEMFFDRQIYNTSPSLSIPSPFSFSSLTSIPEGNYFSDSTIDIGSKMSCEEYSDFIEDEMKRALEETEYYCNEEMERESRRRRRQINSTGSMHLSEKSDYRMSLYSPQTPIQGAKLSFTPFAGLPTTPMHVYQYRPAAPTAALVSRAAARTRRSRTATSPRFPSIGRGKRRGVKPRRLLI